MNITTILELENWMAENCIINTYTPGNRFVTDEGLGLERNGDLFVLYHSERGERHDQKYFKTENEAAEYLHNYLRKDKYANSHLIGCFKDRKLKSELITELINRDIKYWNDEITQWGINNNIMRIFVYRCDVKKVVDLKEKYLIEK